MLKKVTGRNLSKTGRMIILIALLIIVVAILIVLLTRPAQKPLNIQEPFGAPSQTE